VPRTPPAGGNGRPHPPVQFRGRGAPASGWGGGRTAARPGRRLGGWDRCPARPYPHNRRALSARRRDVGHSARRGPETSWVVAAGFAYPAFINTGMRLGLAPVTGLSLPLVSSGGSALFATLIELGLLQNIARRHHG